jgi:hypothetical protein
MTHKSQPDRCVYAGILVAAAALFLHVGYWIAGPVLLILLLCAYPQSYELAASELIVHDSLTRRRIPYGTIAAAEPEGRHVRIRYGLGSEIVIAPADPAAFLDGLTPRMPRDRYIEYCFDRPSGGFSRHERRP